MVAAIYPIYGEQKRIDLLMTGSDPNTFTLVGDTHSNTTLDNLVGSMIGIAIGATITGAGIPANTTLVALNDSANTGVLSQAATATATGVTFTITNPTSAFAGLDGATVRLYRSTLTPGKGTTLANLVAAEATFDGYAAKTLTMDTGFINGAQQAVAESQLLVWTPTASVTPNTIGGLWSDDGTGAVIIWPLPAPVALAGPTTTLKVVATDAYETPGAALQVLP